jgi:hypothetical protein
MGLGKSLTIIALIASTLDAMANSGTIGMSPTILPPSEECNRVTLIVTPKSSRSSARRVFAAVSIDAL